MRLVPSGPIQGGGDVSVNLDWRTGIAAKDWESAGRKGKIVDSEAILENRRNSIGVKSIECYQLSRWLCVEQRSQLKRIGGGLEQKKEIHSNEVELEFMSSYHGGGGGVATVIGVTEFGVYDIIVQETPVLWNNLSLILNDLHESIGF
ncbi:transmembrane emp24 domain-containing protein p24delta3-like [Quillaja saponaria]|uniref:Transmembrane emp24 domain-containing protein p24delta3-like n=1 Tax=Quillaja saponaria TaxID=32244 RepID=A0AAD7L0R7_QUISA|nr:transmembrane emp24 domain-containing protein p24delta3-like [Quillaja saponaria]